MTHANGPVMRGATPSRSARRTPRGFTIIELLMVVLVIGVLATILLITVGQVRKFTQGVSAERQLEAISNALEEFHTDLQYYPPLLGFDTDGWDIGDPAPNGKLLIVPESLPSVASATKRLRQARYGSEYTLAAYLVGAGDLNGKVGDTSTDSSTPNQGANTVDDDGAGGPGFRSPGPDRSWGGAADRARQRAIKSGRVFGPYLDPSSLEGRLVVDPEVGMFKINDLWGQPIRYYANWPTNDGAPGNSNRTAGRAPIELRSAAAMQAEIDTPGEKAANMEIDRALFSAPYMLLSAGLPDEIYSDGSPRPVFGDRKFDRDPDAIRNLLQRLSDSDDFDITSLSKEEQDYLMASLASNIRVTR